MVPTCPTSRGIHATKNSSRVCNFPSHSTVIKAKTTRGQTPPVKQWDCIAVWCKLKGTGDIHTHLSQCEILVTRQNMSEGWLQTPAEFFVAIWNSILDTTLLHWGERVHYKAVSRRSQARMSCHTGSGCVFCNSWIYVIVYKQLSVYDYNQRKRCFVCLIYIKTTEGICMGHTLHFVTVTVCVCRLLL